MHNQMLHNYLIFIDLTKLVVLHVLLIMMPTHLFIFTNKNDYLFLFYFCLAWEGPTQQPSQIPTRFIEYFHFYIVPNLSHHLFTIKLLVTLLGALACTTNARNIVSLGGYGCGVGAGGRRGPTVRFDVEVSSSIDSRPGRGPGPGGDEVVGGGAGD